MPSDPEGDTSFVNFWLFVRQVSFLVYIICHSCVRLIAMCNTILLITHED